MTDVPTAVEQAFRARRERGEQQPVTWTETSWRDRLKGYADISGIPNPLGRDDVVEIFAEIEDERTAVRAFAAAMIWGYGAVGYGAWRTQRILGVNDSAPARLLEVARITKEQGGPAGFENLAENPLTYLGVAFGTKYLFFCAEASADKVAPAPILDRVVRAWLSREVGLSLDIGSWNHRDYREYCAMLGSWAEADGLSVGDAEEAIFEFAVHGSTDQGPTLEVDGVARTAPEVLDELATLLERMPALDGERRAAASDCLEKLGCLLEGV